MKKLLFLMAILVLAFSVNTFGQNQRKKRNPNFRPEVNDEVLVTFRKKPSKLRTFGRRKSAGTKIYRVKSIHMTGSNDAGRKRSRHPKRKTH